MIRPTVFRGPAALNHFHQDPARAGSLRRDRRSEDTADVSLRADPSCRSYCRDTFPLSKRFKDQDKSGQGFGATAGGKVGALT